MKRREFMKLAFTGALVAPFHASAQQQMTAVIGLLTTTTPDARQLGAIQKGLAERGYVEGRNLTTLYRSADGKFERLPALAGELVESRVSVILAYGAPVPARSAKAMTSTIPIVFAYGGDPVIDGLVASLSHPGGNVTGATFIGTALSGKKLEFLGRLLPEMSSVALLVNRKGTLAEDQIKDVESATQKLRQRLHVVDASTDREIESAFEDQPGKGRCPDHQHGSDARVAVSPPNHRARGALQNSGYLSDTTRDRGGRADELWSKLPRYLA